MPGGRRLTWRTAVPAAVAILLVGCSPRESDRITPREPARMIPTGTWRLESRHFRGRELPGPRTLITFSADRFEVRVNDTVVESGSTAFDTSSTPFKYDTTVIDTTTNQRRRHAGIYRMEGDILTACVNVAPGGVRPTAFVAPEGTSFQLTRWRRLAEGRSFGGGGRDRPER
jgi:uncharacterized protein (TIGR03067 family)